MTEEWNEMSMVKASQSYGLLHDTLARGGHAFGTHAYRVLAENAAKVFGGSAAILLTYTPKTQHMVLRAGIGRGVDVGGVPEGAWLNIDLDDLRSECDRVRCQCPAEVCALRPFCMLALVDGMLSRSCMCRRIIFSYGGQPMAVLIVRDPSPEDEIDTELVESYTALMRLMLERLLDPDKPREEEDLYRNLIEATGTGYVVADLRGVILDANDEYARMTGLGSAEQVLAQNIADNTMQTDKASDVETLLSCAKDRVVRHLKVSFVKPDGGLTFAEVNASRVCIAGQDCILALCQDITERQQLENQLAQAQKLEAIGQLAAGIAHEINTPTQYVGDNVRFIDDAFRDVLNVLDGLSALLDAAEQEPRCQELACQVREAMDAADIPFLTEEVPAAARQSQEGIERVGRIVRAMKEFSHPGSEAMSAIDINKMLQSTLTVCRNEWKYCAEMQTDFDDHLPVVPCLASELSQVFLNLIVNAAHAIEDVGGGEEQGKGTIGIRTCRCEGHVMITITDTGSGIPDDIRDRIFDPFFTTKDVGRGTGQGLAIARSIIVEKHSGVIDFTSTPGQGTTFTIKLPLCHADVEGGRESAA